MMQKRKDIQPLVRDDGKNKPRSRIFQCTDCEPTRKFKGYITLACTELSDITTSLIFRCGMKRKVEKSGGKSNMGKASKYAYLVSVRRKAKDISNLLNGIVSQFGTSIEWHRRTGYHNIKPLEGRNLLYFRFRGSVFSKKLELLSYNIELVTAIKKAFPYHFEIEVEIKEG